MGYTQQAMEGTKQVRLTHPDQIKTQLATMVGKTVQVVLVNGTITMGKLLEISPTAIIVKHMRLKKMQFPFSSIAEVYFDLIV